MNKCSFTGRFTRDPEIRKTQSGTPVANFSLAVDRPGTGKDTKVADFFDFIVWGGKDGPGRAGVIEKYFRKGDGIVINEAVAQMKKWTDKDGKQHTGVEFVVRDFEFPMGKRNDGQTGTAEKAKTQEPTPVQDEDLPF